MKLNLLNLNDKSKQEELGGLEEAYSLYLPNKFKSFCNYFNIGKDLFRKEYYFLERYNKLSECSYISFPNDLNFELSEFLDLSSIFEHYKLRIGYGNEDYANNLIKIATINKGGALLIGFDSSNFDKIFVNLWDNDPCHHEIASDIFDFILKCEYRIYNESDLIDDSKYIDFYKKWNEEFWRIRL